jgi:hypothetical protein
METEMYQMVIKPKDPDRYLPPSWDFQKSPGMTAWATALDIAERENVTVVRVIDKNGLEVLR